MNRFNRIVRSGILFALVGGSFAPGAFAASATQWEGLFENRAETLVKAITGASSVWVFAKANGALMGDPGESAGAAGREILPGISTDDVATHLGHENGPSLERPAAIQSVELYIVLPASVSAARIQILRSRLPALLGLNLRRRDRINIEQVSMAHPWAGVWEDLTSQITRLLVIALLAALLVGAFLLLKPTIRLLVNNAKELESRGDENGFSRLGGRPSPSFENPRETDGSPGPPPAARGAGFATAAGSNGRLPSPFSFIDEANLDSVIHLLSSEPPELVAYVASHVAPSIGAVLLNSGGPEKRQAILKELASLKVHEPATIRALVERLAAKTQCLSGGTDLLGEILQEMDPDTQESTLRLLEKANPRASQELRRGLIKLEDIFSLEPAVFRQILGEAYRHGVNLASFLRSRPPEEQQKALSCMPPTLQRIVEVDLRADIPPAGEPERQAEAAKRLLRIAKRHLSPASKSRRPREEGVC